MNSSHKPGPNERWTDKLNLDRGYTSLEDTISPEFFQLEREAVFRPSWLYIGRTDRLDAVGDYFTKEIEVLKASVLATRNRHGEIRVFHNVCPHRGNKLVWNTHAAREVSGRCSRFFCKFHGIGYGLDGNVEVLTDKNAWMNGQGEELHLAEVPFEVWNGFIFVNLNPGGPSQTLRQFLGEAYWNGFDGYPFDKMTERSAARATAQANWKAMMDGFAEVYHAATTHALPFPGNPMNGESFPGEFYATEGKHRQYIMQRYPDGAYNFEFERVTQALALGPRYPFAFEVGQLPKGPNPPQVDNWGTSCTMFWPNFWIQIYYPGWYVTYTMWPLEYNKMRFEIEFYMPKSRNFPELLSHKAGISMFLDAALQDFSLLEAQQQGLEARVFSSYPLTDEEVCVRHLHKEIAETVNQYVQNAKNG